ncbi:hypothetical protein BCR36DRAFT_585845 [Piromyces finnis]|uniref:N-acetyltransferase domain-containing protein n=1 Tax=Piromyces finnis TaxID=1754191 RepID=A0A1Y1V349_9FUNG|nr:hypothetical protein BCR36DRAFT_585845 [Piromyces finnis]|eukprot:ORX45238.1 hypothetical protein BCR36DRAFT_585845 [Piromyces finnis]
MPNIKLLPLENKNRETFILGVQESFKYGALEEFGKRDDHLNKYGEIISRKTIEKSIDGKGSETYQIFENGNNVGGVIVSINREKQTGELEILYVSPAEHSKGIGYATWCEIEKMYPEIKKWETYTPYFEKRNIHFYVNRCGFQIDKFYNSHYPMPQYLKDEDDDLEEEEEIDEDDVHPDDFLHFIKIIQS